MPITSSLIANVNSTSIFLSACCPVNLSAVYHIVKISTSYMLSIYNPHIQCTCYAFNSLLFVM